MTTTTAGTTAPTPLRKDARTIGLIGLAHGTSHFFHMLLPPLFPWLIGEFGYSYSELGLLVSVFFVVSGVGQALSGFLVDRVGARPVLFFALAIRDFGLAITGVPMIMIASFATPDFRWKEAIVFGLAITAFCALIFPYALGQPIPLWPTF